MSDISNSEVPSGAPTAPLPLLNETSSSPSVATPNVALPTPPSESPPTGFPSVTPSVTPSNNDNNDNDNTPATSSPTTSSNKGGCDCSSCQTTPTTSTTTTTTTATTTTLTIVTPPELQPYLQHHINEYQQVRPSIQIQLELVSADTTQSTDPFRTLQQRLLSGDGNSNTKSNTNPNTVVDPWDGAIFPSQLMGTLQQDLWPLDSYHQQKTSATTAVLPFVQRQALFANITKSFPLDANLVRMLYRKDLLEQHQLTVPRTWDEYLQVSRYFDQNTNIQGSCIHTSCGGGSLPGTNAHWTFLVLSTMTQTMGTASGFLLDPISTKPLWGDAMEETLRLYAEHGHQTDDDNACGAFARGECALTYSWQDSPIPMLNQDHQVGVAPTPGSIRVMDRLSGQLENCTPSLCPFGDYYDDIGLVNRAPYAAYGAWTSGVANTTDHHTEMADFFSYLQTQSLSDVLPNNNNNNNNHQQQLNPYRYDHTDAIRWIQDAGMDATAALGFTQASRTINSLNAVMDLRVPNVQHLFDIFDQEVSTFLQDYTRTKPTLEFQEAIDQRKRTATRISAKVENWVASFSSNNNNNNNNINHKHSSNNNRQQGFVQAYQDSLGFATAPKEAFNYIDEDYRAVAWGMGGLICMASVALIFWTILFRSNRVMKAFQPYLLIQCAIGVLLMGGTIFPLGFDDQNLDKDILDISCMAIPWAYVIGFTIFYSSVFCKIQGCAEIFKDPHKHKVLFVSPSDDAKFTLRLLVLNGTILALWTVTDPLLWVRQELEGGMMYPDGTVETYGMCRGKEFTSFALAALLYFLNMFILAIGIVRASSCRFLVMEYNELQWLTLSLFPFLECWMVAGSVLALSSDDPTVMFSTLAFVISVSCVCAGMAIFAPKDWYVRKHKYMETRSRKETDHPSASGIMLLQHPKFENQKQMDHLHSQLQETLAYNTELELEIRGLQERFREISFLNDQYINSQRTVRALASPRNSRSRGSGNSKKVVIRPEQAPVMQQVWKMPDSDDDDDDYNNDDRNEMDPTSRTSGELRFKAGQGDPSTNGKTMFKSSGSKPAGPESDLNDLDNMVNRDDVEALGPKADIMANKFKERAAGKGLIGDGVGGVRILKEGIPADDSTKPSPGDEPRESPRDDENDELVLESTRESIGAYSMFHYNGYEPSRAHTYTSSQKPGEPSGDDRYTNEEEQRRLNGMAYSPKESLTPNSGNSRASPDDAAKRIGVSFHTDTQFNTPESGPTPYPVGTWSAVGETGGVLGDMSDCSSFSSATSSALSTTSMEPTTRASSLDTPFAKEIDNLVAKKDWDGVQLVTNTYKHAPDDSVAATAATEGRDSIEAKKRRKRELEASFGRSVAKSYTLQ